jgi:hypothetical protein
MSEDIGWMIFGVAVAVLGIVIIYAWHRKSEDHPKG